MTRPQKRVVALILTAGLLLSSVATPSAVFAQSEEGFGAALETSMPSLLEKYGVSGSVVGLIEDGDVAWTHAYGLADISSGTPMNSEMVFEFGSLGKILTAWTVMRLAEAGKIDLDLPVNGYLRRWQIESGLYDVDGVTARRLMSHTAGLNIHGYLDHSPRRVNPPDLVQSLVGTGLFEGLNEWVTAGRPSLGRAKLVQEPGSGYLYSGAGFGVLQMLIEDVTGEPFDVVVKNEVTDPLGVELHWAWTPDLEERAPTPYSDEGRAVEYRQLSIHGIGSEIGTVTDFALFAAAMVAGPNGEPPGRGVLQSETIEEMISPWKEGSDRQGFEQGLGYALGWLMGQRSVWHRGATTGWEAYFVLDTVHRQGFVIASPSSRARPLHDTVLDLWFEATYGGGTTQDYPPAPSLGPASTEFMLISALLVVMLAAAMVRFVRQVRSGCRRGTVRPSRSGLLWVLPWVGAWLFGWYTIYSRLPLYLPSWYPDLWPTTGSLILMFTLTIWVVFGLARVFFPRVPPVPEPEVRRPSTAGANEEISAG